MILSENDIMVDVETLGIVPGCAILSIGACAVLSPQNHFYMVCSDPLECGLTNNSSDTLRWWLGQSESARQALMSSQVTTPGYNFSYSTENCLYNFQKWLGKVSGHEQFRIWSYGADFDLSVLRFALTKLLTNQKQYLWNYKQSRCLRTFFDICGRPDVPKPENEHNALIDAQYQSHLLRLACNQQEIPQKCNIMPSGQLSAAPSV